jgi:hypothetical protein
MRVLAGATFQVSSVQMAKRARMTFALALVVTVLAVIGRQTVWIAIPVLLFALFLIAWAQEQRATEAFVKDLPWGRHLFKGLEQIDALLVPQDREYAYKGNHPTL